MHYLVGDLQGCCDALDRLLATLDFSPSRDHVHLLGDLVNRGPQSLATLQRLASLGDAATCLLGNHDMHLLAVAAGVRKPHKGDTFGDVLADPRREHWLDWLRHRRLAHKTDGWLVVHAGVVPQWDADTTLALAGELEALLRGPDLGEFLKVMYGDQPARWDPGLQGFARWRFVLNVLTRIRFCAADGTLEFATKEGTGAAPAGYAAWFEQPLRRTAGTPMAFGHWSTLGLIDRPQLLAIDTGCVWGRQLTAVRVDGGRREVIQIDCPAPKAR
jgi:bis(5'-nucleosyl)-tetraphosphatase (symmetrical)